MSNEQEIEQKIQHKGLNVPRVAKQKIDDVIDHVHIFTAADGYAGAVSLDAEFNALPEEERVIQAPIALETLTICVIVLKNGFTVTGENRLVKTEDFDAEIGRKIAYENARKKIWELEGYLLKDKLHNSND